MSDDVPLRTPAYRVQRPRGMDPATKRLALIAAGLGGALLVLIGAWSMTGGHSGGIPVVAPPPGPLRVKPTNPGGMKVAGADQAIFRRSAGGGETSSDVPMPPPETPDLAALRAPPAPPAAAAPAPATTPPTGIPTAPAAGPALAPAVPRTVTAALPLPPRPPLAIRREQAAARAAAPSSPADRPAPAGTAAATGVQVQLAALPTRAKAEAEWERLQHHMPALLGRRKLVLSQVRLRGETWWRVRTGGFSDPAAARALCARVRLAGASCDVTPF